MVAVLKKAQRGSADEGPDFFASMHAVPATDVLRSKQKQHGRDGASLFSIGASDGDPAALHFSIPATLWMGGQLPCGDQGRQVVGHQRR